MCLQAPNLSQENSNRYSMNQIKKQKLVSVIKTTAADFFLKNSDSFLNDIIITNAESSMDGKTVIVWVRVDRKKVTEFNKRQNYFQKSLRIYIAENSSLRYCPAILLRLDNSFEATQKIEDLL